MPGRAEPIGPDGGAVAIRSRHPRGGERHVDPAAAPTPPGPIDAMPPRGRRLRRHAYRIVAGALLIYLMGAYLPLPLLRPRYAGPNPALEDVPGVTRTAEGTDGDPINVANIGTKAEVMRAMV